MAAQEREQGGVEYAIVRDEDGAYLFDPEGDGTDPSWEADVDNGSWWGTEAEALANANTNGLTKSADSDELVPGYHVASRPAPDAWGRGGGPFSRIAQSVSPPKSSGWSALYRATSESDTLYTWWI